MRPVVCLVFLLIAYLFLLGDLSRVIENRPTTVKLGYVPSFAVVDSFAGDQKLSIAALYTFKAIIYYGEMIQQWQAGHRHPPEFDNLFGFLSSSIHLDPYNMDSYYFTQASFTWGINKSEEVNKLLEYGMGYRTWDWLLPFYAAFNADYFLHDKSSAARFMARAAKLSGNSLLTKLTSRYLQGAGKTGFAIAFLENMISETRDKPIIEQLETRKQALVAIFTIESAVDEYQKSYHSQPAKIADLLEKGLLPSIPVDPYGGTFFLDQNAAVHTTSKMTFAQQIDNQ